MAHGIAIDPVNADVWIADREEYRLVVYTANGQFVKTVQMRNLMSALAGALGGERAGWAVIEDRSQRQRAGRGGERVVNGRWAVHQKQLHDVGQAGQSFIPGIRAWDA